MKRLLLGLIVGILLTAAVRMAASEPPSSAPLEYLVISVPASPEDLQRELNRRGGEGWEFVNGTRTALGEALVLKRPAGKIEIRDSVAGAVRPQRITLTMLDRRRTGFVSF